MGSRHKRHRWPVAFATAGLVALLVVLPNPLFVPRDEAPSTGAYAPVPGPTPPPRSANFAPVQAPNTEGIGATAALSSIAPSAALPTFLPRQKDCVGDPPRQTEDRLSPPCVPFFEGDNGGATARGVTKDRIEVVIYHDWAHKEVDLTKPWRPSDENPEGATWVPSSDYLVRTLKAHLAYFQERFQTYGRRVHAVLLPASGGGLYDTCHERRADAQEVIRRTPFAVITQGFWNNRCFLRPVLEAGIMIPGAGFDLPRSTYRDYAPQMWGFYPDQETTAALSGSMLCSLRGQPARLSSDPQIEGQERKIGLITPNRAAIYGPERWEVGQKTGREMERRCGRGFDLEISFRGGGTGSASTWAPNIITRFKRAGITTIACECMWDQIATFQNTATSLDYFPEWYFDMPTKDGAWKQFFDPMHASFGVYPRWRQPAFPQQQHYQAYLSKEPGTAPNMYWSVESYRMFLTLFTAIQVAGPDLTQQTVRRGMFTVNRVAPMDGWIASGGYGPYDARDPGHYTFVDTAVAWTYDPAGTPPGGPQGDGCLRLALGGRRFFPGEWPEDDAFLTTDAPCTRGDAKITNEP